MPKTSSLPPKFHQTAQQKQDRTDDASKSIQELERRAREAKTTRLREARLKQAAEDKAVAHMLSDATSGKMKKQKRKPSELSNKPG